MSNVNAQSIGQGYTLYHGDCVDVLRGLPDNSIDFSVFSPPFASLYTYSPSPRDFGNAGSYAEFFEQYAFLAAEQFRVHRPGRLIAVHCMQLATTKGRDGYISMVDFRGDLIRAYQRAGFLFHSEVFIWKDPVNAMQRTKANRLLYMQLKKDSVQSGQGFADYLMIMGKPGANDVPVTKDPAEFPVQLWQRYASPAWVTLEDRMSEIARPFIIGSEGSCDGSRVAHNELDRDDSEFRVCSDRVTDGDDTGIDPGDTLQFRSAREHADERHICLSAGSLVLTLEHGYLEIEEINPGDHVLTHKGRWMPVLAKICNGVAETIKICAQGVGGLILTPDHKLWTRVATKKDAKQSAMKSDPVWVDANTTLGSYLNLPLPPEESNELTSDEWWIVGRYLGDGHRGGHKHSGKRGGVGQFLISCNHSEADDLISMLGVHAGHVARVTATQIAVVGLRKEVRDVLDRCGRGAANKRLPGEAVTLDKSKSEALLLGYLSADGHYVKQHDRSIASSVSRGLLLGIAIVAHRARGVVASIYAGRPEREGEIEGRRVHMLQDWIFAFRNSDGRHKSGWIDENGAWKKVRKIETAGECEVWDLQVAEDASFVAEGAVVHNCPLQLPVIRRAIKLWSNPGDVVLSPFAGIGSEGVVAIKEGRRFIGAELKESYYKQASRNLEQAERPAQMTMDIK